MTAPDDIIQYTEQGLFYDFIEHRELACKLTSRIEQAERLLLNADRYTEPAIRYEIEVFLSPMFGVADYTARAIPLLNDRLQSLRTRLHKLQQKG